MILPFAHTKQGVFIQETTVLGDIVHTLKVPTQASLGRSIQNPLQSAQERPRVRGTSVRHVKLIDLIQMRLHKLTPPPINSSDGKSKQLI